MRDDEADVQQGDEDGAGPQRALVLLGDGADALIGIEHAEEGRARATARGLGRGSGPLAAGGVSPASSIATVAISTIERIANLALG